MLTLLPGIQKCFPFLCYFTKSDDESEKITSLDSNTEIIAYLEDVDDEQAAIIKEELTKRLPKGTYVVEIGKDDVELGGINIGLGGQITIE